MKEKLFEIKQQLADLRFYVWELRPVDFLTLGKEGMRVAKPIRLKKEHLREINSRLRHMDELFDEVLKEMS